MIIQEADKDEGNAGSREIIRKLSNVSRISNFHVNGILRVTAVEWNVINFFDV